MPFHAVNRSTFTLHNTFSKYCYSKLYVILISDGTLNEEYEMFAYIPAVEKSTIPQNKH